MELPRDKPNNFQPEETFDGYICPVPNPDAPTAPTGGPDIRRGGKSRYKALDIENWVVYICRAATDEGPSDNSPNTLDLSIRR